MLPTMVHSQAFCVIAWLWLSTPIESDNPIQDFKLGGAHLKKIAPSGGRRENFWGISCEKSRFYAKKSYFFQF